MNKRTKRWLIVAAIILGVLIILIVLSAMGVLPAFSWEGITMLIAALAGPFQYGFNRVRDNINSSETDQIIEKHEEIKKEEKKHREQIDKELTEKQKKLESLDKDIKLIETKIELIETKRQNVTKEVEKMTVEQKTTEAQNLWGS